MHRNDKMRLGLITTASRRISELAVRYELAENAAVMRKGNNHLVRATLKAPAKINLGLWVKSRGLHKYHAIRSLFWPVALYDDIELGRLKKKREKGKEVSVQFVGEEGAQIGQKNTLTSAFSGLRRAGRFDTLSFDLLSRCKVLVRKRIPIQTGLGGGSSDAGTLLRALGRTHLRQRHLIHRVAETVGSDVPFFLNPVPSWVSGRGEKCEPLVWKEGCPKLYVTCVIPPFRLSTKRVFAAWDSLNASAERRGLVRLPCRPRIHNQEDFEAYLCNAQNALEPAACALEPKLKQIIDIMRRFPFVYCGMTGSGSGVVGVSFSHWPAELTQGLFGIIRRLGCRVILVPTYDLLEEGELRFS